MLVNEHSLSTGCHLFSPRIPESPPPLHWDDMTKDSGEKDYFDTALRDTHHYILLNHSRMIWRGFTAPSSHEVETASNFQFTNQC